MILGNQSVVQIATSIAVDVRCLDASREEKQTPTLLPVQVNFFGAIFEKESKLLEVTC